MQEAFEIKGIFWHNEDSEITHDHPDKVESVIDQILVDHSFQLGCINIVLCSDDYLLQMNKEYLDHDYYTDIITFPIQNDPLTADLFISVDRVQDNAEKNDVLFNEELSRVIFHGVLHLVGYGDKAEEDIKEMREKENFYLLK